mgnify:CR=1 FL=1|jgi:hypothetical protein
MNSREEKWIRDSIKTTELMQPSADFTNNLMQLIKPKHKVETAPLISKNAWYAIVAFIGAITLLVLTINVEISYSIPLFDMRLPMVKISNFTALLLTVVAPLFFLQTVIISKYFKSAVNWG